MRRPVSRPNRAAHTPTHCAAQRSEWLFRALEYVTRLIADIEKSGENEKMAPVARKAYDETLSRFHPWIVRKGVHLAVYILPHRADVSFIGHIFALQVEETVLIIKY